MVVIFKEKSGKKLAYSSRNLEQFLNKKYNWHSPHAKRVFEKQNANLSKIFSIVMKDPSYELTGYDLMLMLQETQSTEESFFLAILRDIKSTLVESEYLFNFVFDYEHDHGNHPYDDLFIDQEYNEHSFLMLATKKNFAKITRFLMTIYLINTHVETYNQITKQYVNVYTYALSNHNTDLLYKLLAKNEEDFWKYTRHTPQSLYDSIEDKSSPLVDLIIRTNMSSESGFHKNQIYMELAMGMNHKVICDMIDYGEINPLYIDRTSGNSALISAVYTRNAVLFDKLMDIAPLWYVIHKNSDGKSAIDYLNPRSKMPIVQHMYERLHTFIKIASEKPKVIIIQCGKTIYINPEPTSC